MEKNLNTLFYVDPNTKHTRAFIDRADSTGKTFSIIQLQETMIENESCSDDQKKLSKENVMIKHYLNLLKNGYSVSEIISEIKKAISMAKQDPTLSETVSQLELEILLAERASSILLESKVYQVSTDEIFIEPNPIDELIDDFKRR